MKSLNLDKLEKKIENVNIKKSNVLSESGKVKINDLIEKVKEGTVSYVNGEDEFSIFEVEEKMSLYVTISPRPKNDIYM